jgi:hypothetical protein
MDVPFERRRAPREPTGIPATYQPAGHHALEWYDCYLVDLTELGAGVRLRGPGAGVGDEISIHVDGPDGPASILLRARVRHVRADHFGATRVGVEFAALKGEDHERLAKMLQTQAV